MFFDKKSPKVLFEFSLIFIFFVLPPMLNSKNFVPPLKPEGFFYISVFISKIVFFSAYEEILYRIYLPYRIKSFYMKNSQDCRFYVAASEIFPVIFFALAHRYLGSFNVLYAAAAGIIFRLLYLALKKKTEYKIEQKKAGIAAALIVIILHAVHNGIIYLLIFKG